MTTTCGCIHHEADRGDAYTDRGPCLLHGPARENAAALRERAEKAEATCAGVTAAWSGLLDHVTPEGLLKLDAALAAAKVHTNAFAARLATAERERDEARAKVERLETLDARASLASMNKTLGEAIQTRNVAIKERDEARANLEAEQAVLTLEQRGRAQDIKDWEADRASRDAALAALATLRTKVAAVLSLPMARQPDVIHARQEMAEAYASAASPAALGAQVIERAEERACVWGIEAGLRTGERIGRGDPSVAIVLDGHVRWAAEVCKAARGGQ